MFFDSSSLGRTVAWVLGGLFVTACSLEVNVHLNGSEDDGVSVEATVEVPAVPEVLPLDPSRIRLSPRPDNPAIGDALWRPWESEAAITLSPRAGEIDPRTTPTLTPFTVAPSILNRDEVVRAMEDAYPPLLKEAGVGGTARIYFFIEADGTVRRTVLDQTSGYPVLDEAAMAVAYVYRFTPALLREEPVSVWVSFPITFQVR
jgi:TonB family protein